MADFPTFQDLTRIARDEALSRNSRLTRKIIERRGTDANAMVSAGVAVGDVVTTQLIRVSAELFLDTAKGAALDRLVFDRYQLLRKPSSPSVGQVELTTLAPAAAGFTIQIDDQFQSTDGKIFLATSQVAFPVGSSGPVVVPIQSSLSGLRQQAAKTTITSADVVGAPDDLVVTNALATAGADDEEKDEQLRDRAKRFYKTSQRGTIPAIERAALGTIGVRTATVFETVEADATPARLVEAVITDALTEELVDATVLPGGYQAQATQLALNVRSELLETRAAGIQVLVTVAQVRIVGITMLLRFRQGANVATTTEAARAVAVAYTNALSPGASFIPTDLETLLTTVPGLNVLGGEVVSPTVELATAQLQVRRTSSAQVVIGAAA